MSTIFSLEGKCAIITGAASGIGLAIAELFAKQGAAVQILDINLEAAQAAAKGINDSSPRQPAVGRVCDVADESSVGSCFGAIVSQYGRIDILVNNA